MPEQDNGNPLEYAFEVAAYSPAAVLGAYMQIPLGGGRADEHRHVGAFHYFNHAKPTEQYFAE